LIGALLGQAAGSIPLRRLELVERLIRGDKVLSSLPADEVKRIRATQAVVAELEPERGLHSLPALLPNPADRQRALAALDEAVAEVEPTPRQQVVIDQVRNVLTVNPARPQRAADGTRGEAAVVA
jgi:hypothetical protein